MLTKESVARTKCVYLLDLRSAQKGVRASLRLKVAALRPRLRVQKNLVEQLLRGFLLFKTSKMVTFGHHFKKGGQKTAKKWLNKRCRSRKVLIG